VLRRFGAGYYVSYLVGYGMLREMAALMTGIIMAGRTGAAFAAELGSMKITEEIDALRDARALARSTTSCCRACWVSS
jgi:phospholipid/cholesterol/gamma-HCH transport system permease protein